MAPASRSGRRTHRLSGALALLLSLLLLSGCAGFSARVTIVPSHAAFDVDLIVSALKQQNGPQIAEDCASLAKSGSDAHSWEQGDTVLCEIKLPVPFKSKQTFVKHDRGRWIFQMTDKSLLDFLAQNIPGFGASYPDGLKLEEFDDFYLQVDFPERVVQHGPGSTVEGNSVIWRDAKQLFTAEGLHAESVDNELWKWIVGIASSLGLLALLGGLAVSLFGFRRHGGGTRTWPAAHVSRWWQRNGERWLSRRNGPDGDAG